MIILNRVTWVKNIFESMSCYFNYNVTQLSESRCQSFSTCCLVNDIPALLFIVMAVYVCPLSTQSGHRK